ncbi:MAG TPA: hypothetical protein EYP90_03820, partial [Chromatiaceae bacterium]|nr:hypothetical protein [Chromatiaceae bacterium]
MVESVKRTADLANSFPDQLLKASSEVDSGADEDVLGAVYAELLGDMGEVQENLDLYMRGDREERQRLQGLAGQLSKIADTLGMLGRGVLREKLARVSELLAKVENGQLQPDDEQLMEIATALVEAEASISTTSEAGAAGARAVAAAGEHAESHDEVVIREAFSEFSAIKEGLERYLHDFSESAGLRDVATEVHKLAGVFAVIELDALVELLRNVEPELARLADEQVELTPHQRGALVDLFAAMDYYLEARLDGRSNIEAILEQARESLRKLTAEPGETEGEAHPEFMEGPEAEEDLVVQLAGTEQAAARGPVEEEPLTEAVAEPAEECPGELERPEEEGGIAQEMAPAAQAGESMAEEAAKVEAVEEGEEAESEAEALSLEAIDPEIFGIFMEEANEELSVIQQEYPKWREDTSEEGALQTFRRSFHTLKGSGRMVGAHVIGEFAWSVENLLNRVMDGTVAVDSEVLTFLDELVAA